MRTSVRRHVRRIQSGQTDVRQHMRRLNGSQRGMSEARKDVKRFRRDFSSVEQFQSFVRQYGTPDSITLQGEIYTLDNYDMQGHEVTYGSPDAGMMLTITTRDRYSSSGTTDASVEREKTTEFRNGFNYEKRYIKKKYDQPSEEYFLGKDPKKTAYYKRYAGK